MLLTVHPLTKHIHTPVCTETYTRINVFPSQIQFKKCPRQPDSVHSYMQFKILLRMEYLVVVSVFWHDVHSYPTSENNYQSRT